MRRGRRSPCRAGSPAEHERIALRLAVAVFDLVLLLVATFHVVYVGAAVGAYGGRTVEAMLPHGPVELGAFAMALALYLEARRERLSRQRIAVTALVSFAALAVAALLEVFVDDVDFTRFVLLLLLAGAGIVGGIWALSSSDLVKQSEKAGARRAHHRRSQPPARPLADDLHRTLAASRTGPGARASCGRRRADALGLRRSTFSPGRSS